ncbi:hypothetical protein IQ219_18140 [Synechocystis sp. LEGE 06083]|uniref:hypothetical protein n=1 Tax=Synechocystis sp. LEGE 06083 TaxID=915336 RepID=UPI00187E15C6|nr:hypothetical protein [Synechocystis sp. LEGE 06083]MBE9197178.1 hypothetical protein [Synechocystis sp. LEGE 06083]
MVTLHIEAAMSLKPVLPAWAFQAQGIFMPSTVQVSVNHRRLRLHTYIDPIKPVLAPLGAQ